MKSRILLGISFLVVFLLLCAIIYPGALSKPYDGDSRHYSVIPESTESFNETASVENFTTESGIPVEKLSESQQRAFRDAKEQPRENEHGPSGRQSKDILVCDSTLVFCDEYRELPDPYNGDHQYTFSHDGNQYTLVEDSDGEQYLVQAGFQEVGPTVNGIDGIVETLGKLLLLGPYIIFLAYRGWTTNPPNLTHSSVGYGFALVGIVFLYPYLLMFTDISLPSWHLPALAVITWTVIFIEIRRGRSRIKSDICQGSNW
ncbi:hypothetical protein [Natrinema versiforme]|uniref:hypothetical protein n=1 Tax=Natrinema versiforme TaxID=88724 RepID=UPI0012688890|nr:hypothetical protein [Natrinema versiforme]